MKKIKDLEKTINWLRDQLQEINCVVCDTIDFLDDWLDIPDSPSIFELQQHLHKISDHDEQLHS